MRHVEVGVEMWVSQAAHGPLYRKDNSRSEFLRSQPLLLGDGDVVCSHRAPLPAFPRGRGAALLALTTAE